MITHLNKKLPTAIIAFFAIALTLSCTKEQSNKSNQNPDSPINAIEGLKQEVAELRAAVDALKSSGYVSIDEFNSLREENDALKTQVANLMSTFFEVDGLRFNKNGDIISVPKIESRYEQQTTTGKLTMTRTFDSQGRLVETYGQYSDYGAISYPPYYWQRVVYEYNGKTVKANTETSSYSYGIYTHKESSEVTYW